MYKLNNLLLIKKMTAMDISPFFFFFLKMFSSSLPKRKLLQCLV